jgi:hypothetical protein
MKCKLFQIIPLALVSLVASSYSLASSETQTAKSEPQVLPVEVSKLSCGYNAPAAVAVENAWDYYFTGSFIYWQAEMDGLKLGNYTYSPTVAAGKVLTSEFDFKPGFKVGLGMNFPNDDWTIYGEYTWIRNKSTTSHDVPSSASGTSAFWYYASPAITFTNVYSSWKHDNNIADLILGRSQYTGKSLTCMPFFGLRGYWMNQHLGITYVSSPTTSYYTAASADSWAVGARAGIQTNWLIGCDFRLIGNVAGSLAYQKFKTWFGSINSSNVIVSNITEHKYQITPNIEGALGLGWGSYLWKHKLHLDFSALYEFHYFWAQNSMRSLLQEATGSGGAGSGSIVAGNLMYQGLTVTAKVDF